MNWLNRLWIMLMIDKNEVDSHKYDHIQQNRRMDFVDALRFLTEGKLLARDVWTELDFIFLVSGSSFNVDSMPLLGKYDEGTQIDYKKHIDSMYLDGTLGVWTLSQRDIFANDWYIK